MSTSINGDERESSVESSQGAIAGVDSARERLDTFGTIAKIAGFATVLLPLAGVITRWVALLVGVPRVNALELAWSAPLSQLTVTGVYGLTNASTYIVVVSLMFVGFHMVDPRLEKIRNKNLEVESRLNELSEMVLDDLQGDQRITIRNELRSMKRRADYPRWYRVVANKWIRRPGIGIGIILVLLFTIIFILRIFYAPFPQGLVSVGVAVVANVTWGIMRRRHGKFHLRIAWPWIAALIALTSISNGVSGITPGIDQSKIVFATALHSVNSGIYEIVGSQNGFIDLYKCGSKGGIIEVNSDLVSTISDESHAPRDSSLTDLIVGRPAKFGLQADC